MKNKQLSTTGQSRKKKSTRLHKGALTAAFAAATAIGLGGCATTQAVIPVARPDQASALHAFGSTAQRMPKQDDLFKADWDSWIKHQAYFMKDKALAKQYEGFLASFDDLRDLPRLKMAAAVNIIVQNYVTYMSDQELYKKADYWAAPIETEIYHLGDCEDYAILQYAILRHLGVPDRDLYVAAVNAMGKTNGIDHAVLLLNIAPEGAPQDFVVLNDAAPVTDGISYLNPKGADFDWAYPYVLADARNMEGFWQTQMERDLIKSLSTSKQNVSEVVNPRAAAPNITPEIKDVTVNGVKIAPAKLWPAKASFR